MKKTTSIILHCHDENNVEFTDTIQSIIQQTDNDTEIVFLGEPGSAVSDLP